MRRLSPLEALIIGVLSIFVALMIVDAAVTSINGLKGIIKGHEVPQDHWFKKMHQNNP